MKASPVKIDADIETALKADPSALEAFEKLPPSHRREYLDWIAAAKKPETRARRIAGMIERLAEADPASTRSTG